MQFVKTADLKPGMRLAKPIYNRMGVLLYERDTKLTIQGINSIENFGLIGIFILEPAEPLPPLSKEDLEFEQYQTVYLFKLRENIKRIQEQKNPETLHELVEDIIKRYGSLDHRLNFTQNLRSSVDFTYKHAISTAILTALMGKQMELSHTEKMILVYASLLYDIGYLNVPYSIWDKGKNLSSEEKELVQRKLENGYQLLHPEYNDFQLPAATLQLIYSYLFSKNTQHDVKAESISPVAQKLLPILHTAITFDKMTAMNLNQTPVSEIAAIRILSKEPAVYPANIVYALSRAIHILPVGCSVELSNGDKALVLEDNPQDFTKPLILRFKNNEVIDLSDPDSYADYHVIDTMKTMDNRIKIDEETLKQFKADERIMEIAERFRQKKERIAAQRAALASSNNVSETV